MDAPSSFCPRISRSVVAMAYTFPISFIKAVAAVQQDQVVALKDGRPLLMAAVVRALVVGLWV